MKDLTFYILAQGTDFQFHSALDTRLSWLVTELQRNRVGVLVDHPSQADFLVYPYPLDAIYNKLGLLGIYRFIRAIDKFEKNARRIIFQFDNDLPFEFDFPSVILRASADRRLNKSNTIAIPYFVADRGSPPIAPDAYHTSFTGYVGSFPLRFLIQKGFYTTPHRLRIFFENRHYFHAHNDTATQEANACKYQQTLARSLSILCPRGTGVNSFRFFETMSAGRIPILISDPCMLPFERLLPYGDTILRVAQSEVPNLPQYLEQWFGSHSELEIHERCRANRAFSKSYLEQPAASVQLALVLQLYYEENRDQLCQEFDQSVLADEDGLFGKTRTLMEQLLAEEDDVNAYCLLVDLKRILKQYSKDMEDIEKMIALLEGMQRLKMESYVKELAALETLWRVGAGV